MPLISESMDEYQARKALSAGMAWRIVNDCPLAAWHASPFNPEYRPHKAKHFDIGEAAHLLVLEPETLAERIYLIEADSFRTVAARASRAYAYVGRQTPLLTKDWALVQRLRDRVREQTDLFDGDGPAEQTYLWEWQGVPCKARVDWIVNERPRGVTLVDLKTAPSASPAAFDRAVTHDGHHLRAAWYLDGWNADPELSTDEASYRFVVVSKEEPHILSEFEIGDRALAWGRQLYRKALKTFRECMATGIWLGYAKRGERVIKRSLPTWYEYALADMEQEGRL